jgi:hypothetical protein
MSAVKDAINTLLGRKPAGPKVRYGVVGAGFISQAAFMPGVGETSNSGNTHIFISCWNKKIISGFFVVHSSVDRIS